jgi:hypothetical protein
MMRPQLLVFCYHKSGTVLFEGVMSDIARRFHLTLSECFGYVARVDPAPDIVLLPHSQLGVLPGRDFRAVRIVRDPRDIWLSGYLYHRRCREPWCVNENFDTTAPIGFPRVPMAVAHRRERWKRDYLAGLGGKSYQRNLLDLDRASGLAFELARYTGCTLEDMRAWRHLVRLGESRVLDVQLERIAADFDATMRVIFAHFGFVGADLDTAVAAARPHDIARMTDAVVLENPHISGRVLSKWHDGLSAEQVAAFETIYGDLIAALGYKTANV